MAGLSLLTKYVIRYRGSHVFNPSNIGLVVAFVVLGSSRVEPLDFWWAPLNAWMIAAYAVIIGGGLLITRRLHLLALAATFWVALAVGIGILAGPGHCMVARWSFAPVCGIDFWRVIVTSPEVLIFLFFMITDPEDGAGRAGRADGVRRPRRLAARSSSRHRPTSSGPRWACSPAWSSCALARPILDRLLPEPDRRRMTSALATTPGGERSPVPDSAAPRSGRRWRSLRSSSWA